MGLLQKIQAKTEEARAKEKIRPLLESRMMRDILLEIGQRGTEKLDPQSVPLDQRPLASKRAAECGTAGLQQSVIREIAKRKPLRAVFRDSGFATSPEKINVGEIFKLLAPDTRVKVI